MRPVRVRAGGHDAGSTGRRARRGRQCDSGSTSATGARATTPTTWPWPRRPTGSATPSCWAAEAYGSDAADRAAWVAGADRADRRRLGDHADPGPHAGDDRDDRGHPRHALRRPVPARARRLRPAGVRGLARRAVRQAARPHPRVRRHRPDGAAPARRSPTTASTTRCRCRTARARRCKLTVHPAARAHPDLPGRGRPEEPGAGRRDRRRLAGDLLRPGARRATTLAPMRAGRAKAGRTLAGFDVVADGAGGRRRRRRSACADLVRWYAALYVGGMGSRRAELLQPARRAGWATGDAAARSRTSTSADKQRDAAAAVPLEFIDRTSLLGPTERIAERLASSPRPGSPRCRVTLYGPTWSSGSRTLRPSPAPSSAPGSREPAPAPSSSASSRASPSSCRSPAPGHLTILERLLGYQIDAADVTAFTAIIQVGAMLATLIYLRDESAGSSSRSSAGCSAGLAGRPGLAVRLGRRRSARSRSGSSACCSRT